MISIAKHTKILSFIRHSFKSHLGRILLLCVCSGSCLYANDTNDIRIQGKPLESPAIRHQIEALQKSADHFMGWPLFSEKIRNRKQPVIIRFTDKELAPPPTPIWTAINTADTETRMMHKIASALVWQRLLAIDKTSHPDNPPVDWLAAALVCHARECILPSVKHALPDYRAIRTIIQEQRHQEHQHPDFPALFDIQAPVSLGATYQMYSLCAHLTCSMLADAKKSDKTQHALARFLTYCSQGYETTTALELALSERGDFIGTPYEWFKANTLMFTRRSHSKLNASRLAQHVRSILTVTVNADQESESSSSQVLLTNAKLPDDYWQNNPRKLASSITCLMDATLDSPLQLQDPTARLLEVFLALKNRQNFKQFENKLEKALDEFEEAVSRERKIEALLQSFEMQLTVPASYAGPKQEHSKTEQEKKAIKAINDIDTVLQKYEGIYKSSFSN